MTIALAQKFVNYVLLVHGIDLSFLEVKNNNNSPLYIFIRDNGCSAPITLSCNSDFKKIYAKTPFTTSWFMLPTDYSLTTKGISNLKGVKAKFKRINLFKAGVTKQVLEALSFLDLSQTKVIMLGREDLEYSSKEDVLDFLRSLILPAITEIYCEGFGLDSRDIATLFPSFVEISV